MKGMDIHSADISATVPSFDYYTNSRDSAIYSETDKSFIVLYLASSKFCIYYYSHVYYALSIVILLLYLQIFFKIKSLIRMEIKN